MHVRNLIGCAVVLELLLLPGLVGCQPAASNSAIEDLTKSVKKLSDDMVTRDDLDKASKGWATKKDVDEVRAKLNDNVAAQYGQGTLLGELAKQVKDDIPGQLAIVKADLDAAKIRLAKAESSAALAADFGNRLEKVEKDLRFNIEATAEHAATLGQIAKKDGANNSIVSIGTMAKQSTQFKEDFRNAVIEALPPMQPVPAWGTVRIDNKMSSWQTLEVNGVSHSVAPLSYVDVDVPAGWVMTRLIGYESTRSWWLAAGYYRSVIINPQQTYYSPVIWYP